MRVSATQCTLRGAHVHLRALPTGRRAPFQPQKTQGPTQNRRQFVLRASEDAAAAVDPELASIFSDPFKGDPFWESVVASGTSSSSSSEKELSASELAAALDRERERAARLERELVRARPPAPATPVTT